ncbi:MAG: bifunctional 5,10-methylenetetrahydrofolate dehydrogenase/5,10-methenyltetrahydrofolate cyclohydrolase [Acidobacteriota bacterium]
MSARILDCRPIGDAIKEEAAAEVAWMLAAGMAAPTLAVVRVGDDPASAVYVGNKVRVSEEIGITSEHHHFAAGIDHGSLLAFIVDLSQRPDVDGILVQLPLPAQINEREILESIDPAKDVDGFHPLNAGRLSQGEPALTPCTPAGVIEILKRSDVPIRGRHAVIVGRSNIVGKPMASLLLKESATVTICHSQTVDLARLTRQADILVAAIGRPAFIDSTHINDGVTVIDVGINKVSDPDAVRSLFPSDQVEKRIAAIQKRGSTLIGDVNQRDAIEKAANFTPVPGGVGLLTVAMLMKNTIRAAQSRRSVLTGRSQTL